MGHVLVFDPYKRRWMCGELLTFPFGALGGVLAWWRVASAHKAISAVRSAMPGLGQTPLETSKLASNRDVGH